ncbi:hypothetical protein WS88_28855 [Burkholderia cepacia]|nr:hypothetical protein WS88_28855 [Burkholderia cepacia]
MVENFRHQVRIKESCSTQQCLAQIPSGNELFNQISAVIHSYVVERFRYVGVVDFGGYYSAAAKSFGSGFILRCFQGDNLAGQEIPGSVDVLHTSFVDVLQDTVSSTDDISR